eukprot:803932-Amorphochlora_amoeboformis.AAC.1
MKPKFVKVGESDENGFCKGCNQLGLGLRVRVRAYGLPRIRLQAGLCRRLRWRLRLCSLGV